MSEKLAEFDLIEPHQFPARIAARHSDASRAILLKKVREDFALDEDVSDEDIFTWSAIISNQRLDSYFTRMADSSLKNYAADATEGVAFLNSHRQWELATGYSLKGKLEKGEGEEYPRVLADFYTVRGIQLNDGLPTDNFIRGAKAGLIRDVSIGFKAGEDFQYTCSICSLSMWDWDCPHIPGVKYMVVENPDEDPSRQREREEICCAWIENARLSEVSAVFDGATPGAMVVKATRELRAGRLKPDVQRMLESAYRINLPTRVIVPVGENPITREVNEMADDKTSGAPDNNKMLDAEIRLEAKQAGVTVVDSDTAIDVARKMRTEIERLKPMEATATEGKALRSALVKETLDEGVRAFGKDFDREAKEKMLDATGVETITELRASWKQLGDKNFPGGRVTEAESTGDPDNPETPAETATDSAAEYPREAYGGV